MSLILTLEHAYAAAASEAVTIARYVKATVLPALIRAQGSEQTIEAITNLVSPEAANIERTAFALLGVAIKSIEDAGAAAGAGGVNVSLDAQLVADLKSVLPAIKAHAAQGANAPAPPAPPANPPAPAAPAR